MSIEDELGVGLDGPFTEEQGNYINSRRRLREELRVAGKEYLLERVNLVDDEGNPLEPLDERYSGSGSEPVTSGPEDRGRTEQQTSDNPDDADAASGDDSNTGGDEVPEFEPVDRSQWKNKDLEKEIEERNAKIDEFNETIEDPLLYWHTLPKGGNKDEMVGLLAQHDRFIYDTKVAEAAASDDNDDTTTS